MKTSTGKRLAALIASVLLAGCAMAPAPAPIAAHHLAPTGIAELRHLGTAFVERESAGPLQHFGGISGADRDPETGDWYLLSDDRSENAPARLYRARIELDESGLNAIRINEIITLRQRDGTPYPGPGSGGEVPDPEAVRIDPQTGLLAWSSEGDRRLGLDPFVRITDRKGNHAGDIPLPANLRFDRSGDKGETGGRHNLTVEGLAYSADGQQLWMAMEAALYQDGPVSTVGTGSVARISRLDRSGALLGQYAYPVDAIPLAPTGGKKRADNGVSEILALGGNRLLVIERSGREVDELVFKFAVRVYEAWTDGATDVQGVYSLRDAPYVPMQKRLLLDLNAAGLGEIDNIEAAAWGPRLPNGHATLVLISDDNFSAQQRNQFLAFEVIEQ